MLSYWLHVCVDAFLQCEVQICLYNIAYESILSMHPALCPPTLPLWLFTTFLMSCFSHLDIDQLVLTHTSFLSYLLPNSFAYSCCYMMSFTEQRQIVMLGFVGLRQERPKWWEGHSWWMCPALWSKPNYMQDRNCLSRMQGGYEGCLLFSMLKHGLMQKMLLYHTSLRSNWVSVDSLIVYIPGTIRCIRQGVAMSYLYLMGRQFN